ncbi:MAG: hypothetical protein HDQ99_01700 [Lachnospiraceae bacterium]|nr:hypothetical protein [Lachnospiraceae bacterium]
MEYFCGDKEEYIKYLRQEKSWHGQYIDPDTTYGNIVSPFYDQLIYFLNTKELDDKWRYSYCSEYTKNNESPVGIRVNDSSSSRPVLYLRSDQFGFSAPQNENRAWNKKYPYAAYLKLGGEKEFVAECIWDVRTLGGCFLWPLVRTGNRWQSMYNIYRGVMSYIEDRVDLTLYEIRSFYKLIKKYPDESNQMISKRLSKEGYLLLKYKDNEEICEWLRHFNSFEGYVDYFCFRPFVDDQYRVIDITNSKVAYDENVDYNFSFDCSILSKESVDGYRMSKQERIASINNKEKIEQILINVKNMTVRRTKYIEHYYKV